MGRQEAPTRAGRQEQPTRSAPSDTELGRTEGGNIIVGGGNTLAPPFSQGQVFPGQISTQVLPSSFPQTSYHPGQFSTQVLPGSPQYSQYGLIQGGSYAQGGVQTVIQGGIEYQQIPVERVEYQTVPIKVTDYQQVAVPIQNVQTYQTPVMRESYQAGGYFEYVPFERSYYENVPVERVEYVPVEKRYTDYYAIEKQYEYVPNVTYENYRDYVPQQKTEYVAQTKVEYVPQVSTEMVPVDRVQERVDYQTVEKTLVHYPQVERQFVVDAEASGRIRRDLVGTVAQPNAGGLVSRGGVAGGQLIQGGPVGGSQLVQGGPVGGNTVNRGLIGAPAALPPTIGGTTYQGGFIGGPASLPPASALPAGQVYAQPGYSGFVQGYNQPGLVQGFNQPSFVQGYNQPGLVQGYNQPQFVQGYNQPGLVQPGQSFAGGYPPVGPAGYQKPRGFAGPLLGGNLAVSQPLGQPVTTGGLINTGNKDGVGLRKGSLADRLANQLKQ